MVHLTLLSVDCSFAMSQSILLAASCYSMSSLLRPFSVTHSAVWAAIMEISGTCKLKGNSCKLQEEKIKEVVSLFQSFHKKFMDEYR